jgi:hypothetical protein
VSIKLISPWFYLRTGKGSIFSVLKMGGLYFLFEDLFNSCLDCLKEAFALFDSDRDGEITVEELGKVTFLSNYHNLEMLNLYLFL